MSINLCYYKLIMHKVLSNLAPKSYNDGLSKCRSLGKELISKEKVDKFLDLGCNDGSFTLEFSEKIKPKEIYGIEINKESCQKSKQKGIKCIWQDLNEKWELESNYFDLILSSQNIEHVHDTRLYLQESYRCLKPNGQIIILTENLSSWANIICLFFGWQPFSTTNLDGISFGNPLIWHHGKSRNNKKSTQAKSKNYGHIRVLTYIGLKDLLIRTGFKNIKIYTRGFLPLYGILSNVLCKIDRRHGHFLIVSATK